MTSNSIRPLFREKGAPSHFLKKLNNGIDFYPHSVTTGWGYFCIYNQKIIFAKIHKTNWNQRKILLKPLFHLK